MRTEPHTAPPMKAAVSPPSASRALFLPLLCPLPPLASTPCSTYRISRASTSEVPTRSRASTSSDASRFASAFGHFQALDGFAIVERAIPR